MELFRGLIDRQEWTDSGSVSERVLRSYLLLFGCVRNYPPCVAKATQLFNQWKDSDGTMRSGVIVLKEHTNCLLQIIVLKSLQITVCCHN